jgi:hypothetical protein
MFVAGEALGRGAFMRRFAVLLGCVAILATPAVAKDKPLPEGIKIISEAQTAQCTMIDIVSAMRFALMSASGTERDALRAAMEKAKAKGANAAVMTSITAHNNQHQVTLTAYHCP